MINDMLNDNRLNIMLAITIVAIVTLFFVNPIAQDQNYHIFADQRGFMLIPNFLNVVSNLPFIIIGMMGIRRIKFMEYSEFNTMFLVFFLGVVLTGFGSAYYHFQPDNQTLVWDRLPMTLAFMALFSFIVGSYISIRLAQQIFFPLLLIGIMSVMYWYLTEKNGHGDLRIYVLVQFLPIILIIYILLQYQTTLMRSKYIWGVIIAYTVSKLFEHFDVELYRLLNLLSGHTLKHLAAAIAVWIFYRAVCEKISIKTINQN